MFISYFSAVISDWFKNQHIKFPETFDYLNTIFKSLNEENRNHFINAILNELRKISKSTYFFVKIISSFLFEKNFEDAEENLMRNILLRFLVKPYPAGLVWLGKDLFKSKKLKELLNKISKNKDKNYDSLINDILTFVSENYKNLDNNLS